MKCSKIIIYYFSGTGNSKNVARWISETAKEKGFECDLIDISLINRRNIIKPASGAFIIFVSPIHGFNYPPIMTHFIARFPKGDNQVALVNTRAGMLIKRWVTPGLSGIAFYLAAFILFLKGYKIKAARPFDMPSNWVSLHPGLNDRTIKFIHERIKIRVREFSETILFGKRDFWSLKEIIQDVLISPIALMYYLVGRFILSKTFFASRDCNNCNVCIKECAVGAIEKLDGMPYWTMRCESCMKCMGACPKKAIETAHGFIFLVSIIYYGFLIGAIYFLAESLSINISSPILRFILESSVYLAFIDVAYRLAHFSKRFSFFEKIITYTSLTKYKFWGRKYKAIKDA